MKFDFPKEFFLGTSTAAAQIETPFQHQGKGLQAKDASIFNNTIKHEVHSDKDIEFITPFSEVYRMSMDWSRLQQAPMAEFDKDTLAHYIEFLRKLNHREVKVMLVLHHFSDPL